MSGNNKHRLQEKYYYQDWLLILISLAIGILGGLFAVFFRLMIGWAHTGFYTAGKSIFSFLHSNLWIIFVPALAGIFVGPLTYYLAREAKGHGVPEVMEAVALKGGRIRMRVIFVKALASASSIGAGASVGREGPIVQMGSGIGSTLGQWFKLSEGKVKTCVGCGAAAGIAATFNAPFAGVMFAQEIILNKFAPNTFIPIVVSSVSASAVARVFIGDIPAFNVQTYPLSHPLELLFYVLLGILASLVAIAFMKTLYKTEDLFDLWKTMPGWFKPVIGGLSVGIIGLYFPHILGVGYETIENSFFGRLDFWLLVALLFFKIVATSITLGSGHSGGVFAPSLFMGATFGGAYGLLMNSIFPAFVRYPAGYAIVGMGAVVAGATQAPITAVLIIFEMTRDYRIILPLMISVVFSTFITSYISRASIYTLKLLRRGVDLEYGKDINIMKRILVEEVMSSTVEFVCESDNIGTVIKYMHDSKHNGFPVVNEKEELTGIITLADIREEPVEGIMERPVPQVMSKIQVYTFPDETLHDVFLKFEKYDIGHLPVVSRENNRKIMGIITRSDLIKAYDKKLLANKEEELSQLGV